ncbi:PREDICTED: 1-acyl-sn-glycerol-3-phosphate acyltransferase epsilon [Pygoscelis adeliae]|nr:PREDICTED: 1-acyl-sn-glycerol-3-phosphate acyltransferase epsilon [Pygoscelis adeliae]
MSNGSPHAAGCPTAVDTESSSYQGGMSLEALRATAPGTSQISAKEPGQQAVRKLGHDAEDSVNHTINTTMPTATQGHKMENPPVIHGIISENKLAHWASSPFSGDKRHSLRVTLLGDASYEFDTLSKLNPCLIQFSIHLFGHPTGNSGGPKVDVGSKRGSTSLMAKLQRSHVRDVLLVAVDIAKDIFAYILIFVLFAFGYRSEGENEVLRDSSSLGYLLEFWRAADLALGQSGKNLVIIYGDLPKNKENVIYLSNHQCTVDWIIADMLAIRQNALGHVRYVLKDGLKWLPLYGWYFSQHGGVYVKRSAKFNEKEMREKLQAQMKAETPMYLVIFPEGTRYNPEIPKVIADSQSFAEKEGLAILKHVLTPRVKATHVAIDTMKDYLDAVYDVTVAYEGTVDHKGQRKLAPSMTEFLCKECPRVHVFIDRIELKDIPEEQMYMRRWLHERFEIKDKLLIEFYDAKDSKRRNKFPGKSVHSKLSLKKTLPSLLFLGGLTASMLLTESGRKLYVKTWIYGTLIGCLWVSIKP